MLQDPPGEARHRLVMLHGFGQTGRCFGELADRLALDHDVSTPDLPGHGARGDLSGLDCPAIADLLALEQGAGTWIGYSLGGRVALHVALRHPGSVRALVLIGATAGIEDDGARAERASLDEARARRLEQLGVRAFMAEWLEMDMFDGLGPAQRFETERARNTVEGLAGSLRNAGTGAMEPLWSRLHELGMPTLVLSGARDRAFGALGERLVSSIGTNASARRIAEAGHAAHLEDPAATHEAIEDFLRAAPGRR
ncbi:MAG: alpha/beta fold hydrolase [Microthrixaceae bacterium]